MNLSLTIIVPIYNEKHAVLQSIVSLQESLRQSKLANTEIICLNDGSTDGTSEILNSIPGIRVINHRVNRGYGAAIKTALEHCRTTHALIIDSDGTYPTNSIPFLLSKMKDDVRMVVGARQGEGIQLAPLKRLARHFLKKMVHVLTGVMVPDLNSGMRVFDLALYREFKHLLPNGFSLTTTITVASLYRGYEICFLPIDYKKRIGHSNIRPLKDFLGFSMLIIRLATYFDPLRIYLPAAYTLFVIGFLRGLRDIYVAQSIGSLSVILIFFGFQIFAVGSLADVVIRRSEATMPETKDLNLKESA